MDLIIGLLYHRNFQIVAAFAAKNKITIVNPISEKGELLDGNPYTFKVQPAKNALPAQIAAYLAKNCSKGNILIIGSGQAPDRDLPGNIKKACTEEHLNVKVVNDQDAALKLLSNEKENYILAFSDKSEYVIELTRRLYELRNDYSMTLFGLPDWSGINGVETEYLVTLKTHMVSSSFIDYQSKPVKEFVKRYQADYKADPELLAFQGYDIAFWFLTALQQYGTGFARCMQELNVNPLQARFNFKNAGSNGYENQDWIMFRFLNYRLAPVNP